jgi:hypothetical protein
MASSELLLTFYCTLSIVVYKTDKEILYNFEKLCEPDGKTGGI